jgi:hypothetical protein
MKSVQPATRTPEEDWRPSQVGDALSTSAHGPLSSPSGGTESLASSLPDNDPTGTFLHQLSQTLTSLRGTLELALLVEADAQDYRLVIQQSLVQAETLVQLFKSYRAWAQGGNSQPCE